MPKELDKLGTPILKEITLAKELYSKIRRNSIWIFSKKVNTFTGLRYFTIKKNFRKSITIS